MPMKRPAKNNDRDASSTQAAAKRHSAKRKMPAPSPAKTRKPARRCNGLDGKRWLQNSISIWSDVRKTADETRLKHPAMFPSLLVERLIETFISPAGGVVLDP